MFFCPPYSVEPSGLFSVGHLVLFAVTVTLIAIGLRLSRGMSDRRVHIAIREITVVLWALEVIKILFVLQVTKSRNPNDYVPLYYCSLMLYAGLFSSLGKGWLRKMGDVFISTGGLVGGACFLIIPNTSLPRYPAFHFVSLHSFLLHGLMVYLGLLMLRRYRPVIKDLKYCAVLISAMCAVALAFNFIWDRTHPTQAVANLMFMSKDFPGTPITVLYRLTGPFFSLFMWLIQAFLPFLGVWGLYLLTVRLMGKRSRENEN